MSGGLHDKLALNTASFVQHGISGIFSKRGGGFQGISIGCVSVQVPEKLNVDRGHAGLQLKAEFIRVAVKEAG